MSTAPDSSPDTLPQTAALQLIFGSDRVQHVREALADRYARRQAGKPLGVETPYQGLNEILGGGFQPGQVYILGAPPGCGKSALALVLARHLAKSGGRPLYLSYEVSPDACLFRALSDVSSTPTDAIQLGGVSPQKLDPYFQKMEAEVSGIAFIDATQGPRPNAKSIARVVETVKSSDPFGSLVIVDYLQIAARAAYPEEREVRSAVANFSRDLTNIARCLKVPILALSSVARSSYGDSTNLASFKEAGDIESDADVAMTLGPAETWENLRGQDDWPLSLRVLKNRHGRTGEVKLSFHRPILRFQEGWA